MIQIPTGLWLDLIDFLGQLLDENPENKTLRNLIDNLKALTL